MTYKDFLQIAEEYANNKWVRRENITPEDIETCNGVAHNDEATNTCMLCVAANNTVYRQQNKCKFSHPHCKCKYEGYAMDGAKTIFPLKKMLYAFTDEDKGKALRSMGYILEDCENLRNILNYVVKTQYELGKYKLNILNQNGQHVQIDTVISGKRDHEGQLFQCHIGCVVWPNGQIRIATPLILDKEIK